MIATAEGYRWNHPDLTWNWIRSQADFLSYAKTNFETDGFQYHYSY
jgi:hypothetical protein